MKSTRSSGLGLIEGEAPSRGPLQKKRIYQHHHILFNGLRLTVMRLGKAPEGISSAYDLEVEEASCITSVSAPNATERIIQVIRETQRLLIPMNQEIAAVITDSGKHVNPGRPLIQALGLQSIPSVVHELTNILFHISALHVIGFNGQNG